MVDVYDAPRLAAVLAEAAPDIVDDEPSPATEWLPVYAAGWLPGHPTWRDGFPKL